MVGKIKKYLSGSGLGPLLVKAVTGSAGLRIFGMFFSFLIGVQLARGLGAEGYGIYGLAMSIVALLMVPTEFGLPQLLTREVARAWVEKDWGLLKGILKWSNRTVLLISCCIIFIAFIYFSITEYGLEPIFALTLAIGLFLAPFVALSNLREAALRGLGYIVKGQISDTLARPALFSIFLALASLTSGSLEPTSAMGLGVLSAALAFLISTVLLRNNLPTEVRSVDPKKYSRNWWASAFPMALTEGMRVLQSHLVILLMGLMTTVVLVGIYRVASSVALFVAMPVTLLNIVTSPVIARLYTEGDSVRLQRLLNWIALLMVTSVLVLSMPFIVYGEFLLGYVFGDEFREANALLLVLCFGVVINGFFGANAILLNMTGHENRVTYASILSLVILIVITPFLIHFMGALGAAIANVIAMFVWNVRMWGDARRLLVMDTSFLYLFKRKNLIYE